MHLFIFYSFIVGCWLLSSLQFLAQLDRCVFVFVCVCVCVCVCVDCGRVWCCTFLDFTTDNFWANTLKCKKGLSCNKACVPSTKIDGWTLCFLKYAFRDQEKHCWGQMVAKEGFQRFELPSKAIQELAQICYATKDRKRERSYVFL